MSSSPKAHRTGKSIMVDYQNSKKIFNNTTRPNTFIEKNSGLKSGMRSSFGQKSANNYSGRKSIKCTTLTKAHSEQSMALTKALSEQNVAQRQRPGSCSPSPPVLPCNLTGGTEQSQGNSARLGFGDLSLQEERAEQDGSPGRVQRDFNASRISWVEACDDSFEQAQQSLPHQLKQHPQQQQQQQRQNPQQNQEHSRKWMKGGARASMKSWQTQEDDEGGGVQGLQAGGTSPRWGGNASPRGMQRPGDASPRGMQRPGDASPRSMQRPGDASPRGMQRPEAAGRRPEAQSQRYAATLRSLEVDGFRDGGAGQLPHPKQGAGAPAPRSPRGLQGPQMPKTWSTGTLSTAPSPNMPGYRDRLRTVASTNSLSSPTPNSPIVTPRPRPGDTSQMASDVGVGSSFDSVHGDDGGSLHGSTPLHPVASKQQSNSSRQWQRAITRSMKNLGDRTSPEQKMIRRASSMRSLGQVASAVQGESEKMNRISVHAQRDSVANVDAVYGPYHGLSRKQGHQTDSKKFWRNTWRFLPDLIDDPDKECFDDQVAHTMFGCSVLPGVAESISRESMQKPRAAAFTDRSIRRREGVGANSALKVADGANGTDAYCDECSNFIPSSMHPAGLVSSRMPHHLQHRAAPGETALPQSPTMRYRSRSGSPNFDSRGVAVHMAEHPDKAEQQPQQQQLEKEEDAFQRRMCRRGKPSAQAPPNPRFVRPDLDLEASSDQYVRMGGPSALPGERLRRKQDGWAGHAGMDATRRGHVAMTLSPQSDDPPLANKTVTGCKKGDGDNKFHISKDSERLFLRANPTMFRYEVAAHDGSLLQRSCSLPPEYERRVRGEGRSLLMHQEETPNEPAQAGIVRQPLVSHNIQEAIQQSRVAESDAQARAQRLVEDKRFFDLCNVTDNTRTQMAVDVESLANTQTVSANMADSLTWPE